MTLSIKKKTLRKVVSSLTMLATVVSMSGIMALSTVNIAAAAVVDGSLIKSNATNSDGSPTLASLDVYIVKLVGTKKFKRLILNPTVFESYGHLNWGDIQTVSQAVMDEYTTSSLVRVDTDPAEKVFAMAPDGDIGSKSWVNLTTDQFVTEAGSDPDSIYTINATDGGNYTAVGDVTTVAELTTFYATGTLPGVAPVPSEALTVALSADTPATRSVVTTEAGADFVHLTFTGTGTVTNVTLKRIGISADASLSSIYLYDGSNRLTDASSVSSGSVITFNDPAGLFTVSGSKTISVKADMAATAGETIGIQFVSATASATTVTGGPISGNLMSIASATLAAVSFGTVTPSANTSLTPASDITVWQSTASVTTRDVTLSHFTIREVGGIAKADLQNIRLMVDNAVVGTVANPDANGYSTFVPASTLTLKTGSHVFKVVADVVGGSSLSFTFSIRNRTDIGLIDSQYGVGFLTSTAVGSLTGFQQTVSTGYITVEKAVDSPSSTVILSATDAVLARYKAITYGESVKVDGLTVDFTSSNATAVIRNGRILVDGSQVGSTTNIDRDADTTATDAGTLYNINYTFPTGESIIEVRGDVYAASGTAFASGDTILVSLYGASTLNNAQGLVSGDATLDVPGAVVNGNTLTVGVGSLVLAKDQTYGNQSVVVPTTATLLGSWTLTSGANEVINLDTIQVDFTTTDEFAPADLGNVYVTYGTKTTSTKATITATSATTSVGNSWSISESMPISSSMAFKVYGNIATGAVVTTTAADNVTPSLLVSGTTDSSTAVNTNSNTVLAGQTITALTSGTLTVALDANTPVTAQVVAGTTPDTGALKIKLTGTNEEQYVKTLKVYVDSSANSAAISSLNLSSATTSTGTYATVGTDQTLVNDGTNPGYATWTLSGAGRVTVPKNGSMYLKVTPTFVSSGQTEVSDLNPKIFLGNIEAEGTNVLSAGGTGTDAINSTGIIIQANSSAAAGRTYIDSTADTVTTAQASGTTTTLVTTDGTQFTAGDIIFVDEATLGSWNPATEDLQVVLAVSTNTLTVARSVFGLTGVAHTTGKNIYRLSGALATYANAGIIGNEMRVLETKLSLAQKSDSPSGAFTGGTGKYLFGVTATAANNSADSATNTATINYFDVTVNKSAATVANLKAYPAEYDNNSTYATTCVGLSTTKWRCTLSTTGSTNQVDENSSRSYTFRGDLGYSAAGSVDFSLAALGTSNTATNSVSWSDGAATPTTQVWVNQPTTVIQGGALTTVAASGTADSTAPTISSVVIANGGTAANVDIGDTITITFSEMVDPSIISSTLVPGSSVTGVAQTSTGGLSCTAATPANTCTVAGIVSFVDTYATSSQAVATSTSTLALNSAGTILTITLTAAAANTNVGAQTITSTTAIVGTSTAGIRDINGTVMAAGALATQATGGF